MILEQLKNNLMNIVIEDRTLFEEDRQTIKEALNYITLSSAFYKPTTKKCPHCGARLYKSPYQDMDGNKYAYQCIECDEDFYEIEIKE